MKLVFTPRYWRLTQIKKRSVFSVVIRHYDFWFTTLMRFPSVLFAHVLCWCYYLQRSGTLNQEQFRTRIKKCKKDKEQRNKADNCCVIEFYHRRIDKWCLNFDVFCQIRIIFLLSRKHISRMGQFSWHLIAIDKGTYTWIFIFQFLWPFSLGCTDCKNMIYTKLFDFG